MMRRSVLLVGLLLVGLIFSSVANAAGDGRVCGGPVGKEPYVMNVWTKVFPDGKITVWTKPANGEFSPMPPVDANVVADQVPNQGPTEGSRQILAIGPSGGKVLSFVTFAEGGKRVDNFTTGRSTGQLLKCTG